MPEVVVVSGIQAAGKSTVAALLARRFPRGVHVAGDGIRAMVVSGRVEMSQVPDAEAERQLLLRYRAAIEVARLYRAAHFAVVIEDVIIGPLLERFLALVPWPQLHLVVLDPDPDEVARREQQREKDAYGQRWSVEALHRVLHDQTPRLGLWLDSTGRTPEQTVDAVLADLDACLVDTRGYSSRPA